jgi:hypothetical protein
MKDKRFFLNSVRQSKMKSLQQKKRKKNHEDKNFEATKKVKLAKS